VPTRLDLVPDAVMVEGKIDFFALRWLQEQLKVNNLCFIPGTGAGSLDTVIRLYIGWGRNFLVLLDGDSEGEGQKKRYVDIFGSLVTNKVWTLADLNPSWAKRGIERMFQPEDALTIQKAAFPDSTEFSKTLFGRSLQELVITRKQFPLSKSTLDDFNSLFSALVSNFSKIRKEASA
jgi:hypothetical protein